VCRAPVMIENCIGLLKQKWRRLHRHVMLEMLWRMSINLDIRALHVWPLSPLP
jgi:hypothetical protein